MRFQFVAVILLLFKASGSSPNFAPPSGLSLEVVQLQHWSAVHRDLSISIIADGSHQSVDVDVLMMENLYPDSDLGLNFDGSPVLGASCLSIPCRIRLQRVGEGNHTLQAINSDGRPCKTFRWAGAAKKISDVQAPVLKFNLKIAVSPPHNAGTIRSHSEHVDSLPASLYGASESLLPEVA
jgi:hypothetical protein